MPVATCLSESDALHLSMDARIVAVRWDLVEWGVVFDLDTPVSEATGAAMKRAWLVFSGLDHLTVPMLGVRLPTGLWLTSSLDVEPAPDGFRTYSCHGLFAVPDGAKVRANLQSLVVQAQSLVGVVSTNEAAPIDYGLAFDVRRKLASDDEMLRALCSP
jgi:hypothetical protein